MTDEQYKEKVVQYKGIMKDREWIISYECRCSGVHRIEFVKGELAGTMVKVYPRRDKWRASAMGKKIGEGTFSNFETFINGLVA